MTDSIPNLIKAARATGFVTRHLVHARQEPRCSIIVMSGKGKVVEDREDVPTVTRRVHLDRLSMDLEERVPALLVAT